jgi:hypothetical protein
MFGDRFLDMAEALFHVWDFLGQAVRLFVTAPLIAQDNVFGVIRHFIVPLEDAQLLFAVRLLPEKGHCLALIDEGSMVRRCYYWLFSAQYASMLFRFSPI